LNGTRRIRLDGKTAVVTGASGGLGRAIALALAHEGADVGVHYNSSRDPAEETAREIRRLGRRSEMFQADLTDEAAIRGLVESAWRELERVDVWLNIAGADILTGAGGRLPDREKLERVIAVDLRGTVLCSWEVGEAMLRQGGGVIVNVSWDHDPAGFGSKLAESFSAAKGGVEAFSKNLALRLAPSVRVNVIAPGWIETAYGETVSRSHYERVRAHVPLNRWGRPDEIARVAVFLASEDSSYVTGQTIRVNGGQVMW
jgi:3-oxoacyl-[acyl-carrier protein] reductase